jgi:tetratricopeptide (TPR) repeat protein
MWQLLLPPVIVILSFSFLLWFLSQKQKDPRVQEEIARLTQDSVESVTSFKAFFWGALEKFARRTKVAMLRFHNTLGDWSRTAKELKERHKPAPAAEDPVFATTEEPALPRTDIMNEVVRETTFIETPITRRETEQEPSVKQNISDIKKEAISHEEDFIAAIAKNPKDGEAYEKLGDYYMDNGNIKDAKECYRQVLRLSPANREVKMKIRRLEKMLG